MHKNKKKTTTKYIALAIHKTYMIRKNINFLVSNTALEQIVESLNGTEVSLSNILPLTPLMRVPAYTLCVKE